ncbi:MAG: DUF6434 domain-containing protein [Chlamydiales bacterium]
MKTLSASKVGMLKNALHYMHMSELKELCQKLALPERGKKGEIIQRICCYLEDGTVLKQPQIPSASKAQKNTRYPLAPSTLILHGNYKNDEKTRKFMKSLVGNHFHFTAFGQDWIKNRWIEGNPPTYAEFAQFWQNEHLNRQQRKANPKQEWAYLNFMQKYSDKYPKASQKEITAAWERERGKQVEIVWSTLNKYL